MTIRDVHRDNKDVVESIYPLSTEEIFEKIGTDICDMSWGVRYVGANEYAGVYNLIAIKESINAFLTTLPEPFVNGVLAAYQYTHMESSRLAELTCFNEARQAFHDKLAINAMFEEHQEEFSKLVKEAEIDEMDKWEGSQLNKAKEILAYELTALVHGEEEAKKAEASAKALFGGAGDSQNMPCTEISDADLVDGGMDIMTALVKTGLCVSKSDARRNIQQGGVNADDVKITDIAKVFTADELKNGVVLKRGKKNFNKIILK